MDADQKLFRDTVENIKAWIPPDKDGEEASESLYSFLSERTNIGKDGFLSEKKQIEVARDSGLILIGERTKVKMIKGFDSESRKEASELLDSTEGYIVVVACGVSDVESWRMLEKDYGGTRGLDLQVDFVWKEEQFFGVEKY